MELVELVTQGIKGAPEMVRLPFAPTVTVLPASGLPLVRIVLDLLYPKGTEPTLADLDDPGKQSRVALTIVGRDNQRYRLLQDVHTGRRALQRMNGEQASLVTSAANEIAQAVTATLGFPTEDVMRGLLFCVREDLPSQAAKASSSSSSSSSKKKKKSSSSSSTKSKAADKPLPPGFSDEGAPVADRAGRSDAELKNRLAEINQILSAQTGVKDLEFEIDGLQKRSFEIDAKLRPLSTLRRSVEQAEAQLQRFHSIERVPADLPEKAEHLRKVRADHDAFMSRMDEERDRLLESSGTLDRRSARQNPAEIAQKDPLVRYGVLGGVGAVVVGVLGFMAYPPLQWFAFLDIPAFGVALFGGIRVLSSLEHGESVRRRVLRIDADKKKLDEKLKVDEEHVKSVLDRAGFAMEQLPDVEEQLQARTEAQQVLEKTRKALADAQGGADLKALEVEHEQLSAKIRALEEQLQTSNAGYIGGSDLEQERAEIEAILRGDTAGEPAQDGGAYGGADPFGAGDSFIGGDNGRDDDGVDDEEQVDDSCKRMVTLANDVLLAGSVETVATQVQGRAGQILGALSDGRFKEVRFSGRADASAIDGAAGDALSFAKLPAFDRDLLHIAVKVALIELVVARGRLPVVFDRGLDNIADQKGALLKNMLQFLAQATQVVSISERASLGGRPAT